MDDRITIDQIEMVRPVYPVILSGGTGTRLWPMSRSGHPKQLQCLASDLSMLQETARRFEGWSDAAPPIIVCSFEHRFVIGEQLREIGMAAGEILLEPAGRNTAPAIAAAALRLAAPAPDGVMAVMPADHVTGDVSAFRQTLARGVAAAAAGNMVTFGIPPAGPETGYGYILRGDAVAEGVFKVESFVEKPDPMTAAAFVKDDRYFWNSGIFVFSVRRYLEELEKYGPDILAACRQAVADGIVDLDFFRLDPDAFAACRSESIDYAVMERTADAVVVPVSMGWNDIGTWSALWEIADKDDHRNVCLGDALMEDAEGCYVRSDAGRLVAAVGVQDLVIVDTGDAVLVARRDRAQGIRAVVDRLKAEGRSEYRAHDRVYRPWGYYETVEKGYRYQVKHLMVKPSASLSLQLYHHRAEHWVVVRGTARVTRGDEALLLGENQSTYIPLGIRHRLENPGKLPLSIIEIQSGPYLEEDDIVRFEDVYSREEEPA